MTLAWKEGIDMLTKSVEYGAAEVMDEMPYGLYIIGSRSDADVNGMMADWLMQVSFEPRLVAVAFENDAHTLENIRAHGHFTVNLLSQDNESVQLAARFAQPYFGAKVSGRDRDAARTVHHKLDGIPYWTTPSGCPVLDQAMAWLECHTKTFIPVGDHTLVVAQVIDGGALRNGDALTSSYAGWSYSG
jgi:flavin reductase (DIM6/NTAB) family NADH-FMN oxidoreductase RutF